MPKTKKKTKKTILLTGGAGFIGSNVLEYLFRKYPAYHFIVYDMLTYAADVRNIPADIWDSKRFHFMFGDIRNQRLIDEAVAGSDIIIHFAAETHVARSLYDNFKFFETDVMGTLALMSAALHHQKRIKRFIHISTSEVYGTAQTFRIAEDHPLIPRSPYAAAKSAADRLVYSFYLSYGTPVAIIRPFNMYGPRQHPEKLIPRVTTNCLLGEKPTIHGDGSAKRDFTYVEDLAVAIDRVMHALSEKVVGEIFNIGSGEAQSVNKITKMVLRKFGLPEKAVHYVEDRPGQVHLHRADISKAARVLGWKPKISLAEGITRTVAWYRENRPVWQDKIFLRLTPVVTKEGRITYQ